MGDPHDSDWQIKDEAQQREALRRGADRGPVWPSPEEFERAAAEADAASPTGLSVDGRLLRLAAQMAQERVKQNADFAIVALKLEQTEAQLAQMAQELETLKQEKEQVK